MAEADKGRSRRGRRDYPLPGLKVRSKIWVECGDEIVISDGRMRLLRAVEQLGSLNKAAAEFGMSYRAAWGKITATERALGKKILMRRKGGGRGGGSSLTDFGTWLLDRYESLRDASNASVDGLFLDIFSK